MGRSLTSPVPTNLRERHWIVVGLTLKFCDIRHTDNPACNCPMATALCNNDNLGMITVITHMDNHQILCTEEHKAPHTNSSPAQVTSA